MLKRFTFFSIWGKCRSYGYKTGTTKFKDKRRKICFIWQYLFLLARQLKNTITSCSAA